MNLLSSLPYSICPSNMFNDPRFCKQKDEVKDDDDDDVNDYASSSAEQAKPASRNSINDMKKSLKNLLIKARAATESNSARHLVLEQNALIEWRGSVGRTAGGGAAGNKKALRRSQAGFDAVVSAVPALTVPTDFGGEWTPFPRPNYLKNNFWLPNETYCSSHIALCVEFTIDEKYLAAVWK
jgi:hypothetical protein